MALSKNKKNDYYKIFKAALTSMFNDEELVERILLVAMATENPSTVIEIILGVYDTPHLPTTAVDNKGRILTLVDHNPLAREGCEVEYEYSHDKTETIYLPKGTSIEGLTLPEIKKLPHYYYVESDKREDYDRHEIKTGETRNNINTCSVKTWLDWSQNA